MTKTPAYLEAEAELPLELRDDFRALVRDYMAATKDELLSREPRVYYAICRQLILAGWRKSAEES